MKAPPFIALAVCAAFLIVRQTTAVSISKQNETLEERIKYVEESGGSGAGSPAGGPSAATKSDRNRTTSDGAGDQKGESLAELDLEKLIKTIAEMETGGVPNLKEMVRLRRLLLEATPEELADLVRRTGDVDAPEKAKRDFVGQLLQVMGQREPRVALELAMESPYLDIQRQHWQFANSFSEWAKEEPSAAVAWLDRQISAGKFEAKTLDGQSQARASFEASAISSLIGSNPSQVTARLLALSEDMRNYVLMQGHQLRISEESESAYAGIVREVISEDQRASIFSVLTNQRMREGGYDRVGEYLGNINATPQERRAITGNTANSHFNQLGRSNKPLAAEEITNLQTFAEAQSPGSSGHVTGEALAQYGRNNSDNYSTALEQIRELHAANPSDDLLVGFLQQRNPMPNQDAARELAGQIQDQERRTQILERLNK